MKNNNCGIYKITNLITKKIYIGQSIHINIRFNKHKSVSMNKNDPNYDKDLYKDMRIYGLNNFSFEIIELCDEKLLNEREIYYISFYNCIEPNGYNRNKGGNTGQLLTPEWVLKVRDELKNSKESTEKIGKKYNVSGRTIRSINNGDTWRDDNIIYPIRISYPKNHCAMCGVEILNESTYCSNCIHIKQRKVANRPNREELKNLIRTKTFTEIGKNYSVNDNTIRKWCKAENLPTRKRDINSISDEDWKSI